MDDHEILWFLAGWIASAITPLLVEASRFAALIIRDAGRRREMIGKAKSIANGRFNNRQNKIKDILNRR